MYVLNLHQLVSNFTIKPFHNQHTYLSILIFLTALCLSPHYWQMHPVNNFRVLSHPHHTLCLVLAQDEESPPQMAQHYRANSSNLLCSPARLANFF